MQYRKFGRLDWRGSALGFGAMRLPVTGESGLPNGPDINEPEAINIIRHAIDEGVNYLDTAYVYHQGKSEVVVGKALTDGYREKLKLATKMFPDKINEYEDFDNMLNEQLEKLQTDRIDFYLLHGINPERWAKLRDLDVLEWAEKTIRDGRIGHLGFSSHNDIDAFREIVDAYDKWTFCQIQYNFMDINYQAGTEGLRYAAEKGLAVVIMEPLRGGQLSKKQPDFIKKLYDDAAVTRTPADLALQWLWNQPEVSLVLSGMTTLQHVVENVASAHNSGVGSLSEKELGLVEQIREEYLKLSSLPCTGCGYCMPCENGVNIPHAFSNYINAFIYDDPRMARFWYRNAPKETWADNCIDCLECEEKCPQDIEISQWLKKAHDFLGPRKKS